MTHRAFIPGDARGMWDAQRRRITLDDDRAAIDG
jgi:hypothetical protein